MKFATMNGWTDAPHCWRYFWKPRIDRTPEWVCVSWLGFVIYAIRGDR
jgi:hypothetical protein